MAARTPDGDTGKIPVLVAVRVGEGDFPFHRAPEVFQLRPYFEWRRWLDARYMPEGDLHIWPDDHIEWSKIEAALAERGVRVVIAHDYLGYEPRYVREVWERWSGGIADMRSIVAVKQ